MSLSAITLESRPLTLLVRLTIFCMVIGCGTIGRYRVDSPGKKTSEQQAGNRVIWILLDRVNQSSFSEYLKHLQELDYEPVQPSGISLLARNEFKLANIRNALGSVPAVLMNAEASLFSGQPTTTHGLLSHRFLRSRKGLSPARFDLTYADTHARFYLTNTLELPTAETRPAGTKLIDTQLWTSILNNTFDVTQIFTPFGYGTNWFLPTPTVKLSEAALSDKTTRQTSRLLAQSTEIIANEVLAEGVDVLVIRFNYAWARSCVDSKYGCPDEDKSLAQRQHEALETIDAQLWRILRTYQMRNPALFERTSFIVTGNLGAIPRPQETVNSDQFSVSENELKQTLFSPSSPECEHAYKTLAPENIIQLTTYSGVGILSRSHIPLGQRLAAQATVDCVIDNWTKIIGSSLSKFVDASAMRNQSTQALQVLDPNQSLKQLTATTRRRLEHQMQSLTRPTWQQQNLAFIFLKAPYVFSADTSHLMHHGGLSHDSLHFPVLIADRRLTQGSIRQLEGYPFEQTDIAPLVYGLMGKGELATKLFPRLPVLAFSKAPTNDDAVLRFFRFQHSNKRVEKTKPALEVYETKEGLQLVYHEGRHIWPPDKLEFSLSTHTFQWQMASETFESPNCQHQTNQSGRTWQCLVSPPAQEQSFDISIRRFPAINGDEVSVESNTIDRKISKPTLRTNSLKCDDGKLSLAVEAASQSGISGLRILPISKDGVPRSLAEVVYDETQLNAMCSASSHSTFRCVSKGKHLVSELSASIPLAQAQTEKITKLETEVCAQGYSCIRSVTTISPDLLDCVRKP